MFNNYYFGLQRISELNDNDDDEQKTSQLESNNETGKNHPKPPFVKLKRLKLNDFAHMIEHFVRFFS